MGWGQTPGEVRAAEEAAREARELAESRPMSPFERKLIGVLEDIRDNIGRPLAAPLPGAALPEASVSITRPDGTVQNFGPGTFVSGRVDPLGALLDSPPAVLARSIKAGGAALSNSFPMFREDLTESGFEKFAEVAIEAALHEAARDRDAEADLLLDATERPRRELDFDLRFAPVSPETLAAEYWQGPGDYTLKSTAAETIVHCADREAFAAAIAEHPIHPPRPLEETSAVQQGSGDEAGEGEPDQGPSPAAPE